MKRFLFLCTLCGMLALCACGHDSAEIIGGADSPTGILVTEDSGGQGGSDTDSQDTPAQEASPLPLSREELLRFQDFFNRADVYGFLLSNYDDVVDADLGEVFYDGADVGEYPSEELRQIFLDSLEMTEDDILGDIIYIKTTDMDRILQEVTGHPLSDFEHQGWSSRLHLIPEAEGCFLMHGDTNHMQVDAVSGTRNPDGTVTVQTGNFYGYPDGEETEAEAIFSTVLRETDNGPQILANHIIGGWLAEWIDGNTENPVSLTAETPPLSYFCLMNDPDDDHTLPVTLDLRLEENNNISTIEDWTFSHWNTWMSDPEFAYAQRGVWLEDTYPDALSDGASHHGLLWDRDETYRYEIVDGHILYIYDALSGSMEYVVDCGAFLSPGASYPNDFLTLQDLRWARVINGILYVSNAHMTYAESSGFQNAYVTAVSLMTGSVLWRSEPLVCNARNFEIMGVWNESGLLSEGIVICGYGFTAEDDFIYQLSLETGKILSVTPVASKPDGFVYANGVLYVHCYDRDYEFDVSYG